jgi:hypothetical protein
MSQISNKRKQASPLTAFSLKGKGFTLFRRPERKKHPPSGYACIEFCGQDFHCPYSNNVPVHHIAETKRCAVTKILDRRGSSVPKWSTMT